MEKRAAVFGPASMDPERDFDTEIRLVQVRFSDHAPKAHTGTAAYGRNGGLAPKHPACDFTLAVKP